MVQRVEAVDRCPARAHDQVAAREAGSAGRAVVGDSAHEDAGMLRQPDRATQSPRDVRGCDGHSQPHGLGALTARELLDAVREQLVGGEGEDQATLEAQRR